MAAAFYFKTNITGTKLNNQIRQCYSFLLILFMYWDRAVPVTHHRPGVRAGAPCHSFLGICHPGAGPQPHCTVCPCSFPERSNARCHVPGVGSSRGWREKGEGVLPLACSAVVRLTQLKVFLMKDCWGTIHYFFSNCLNAVVFKVPCRLLRKSLFT